MFTSLDEQRQRIRHHVGSHLSASVEELRRSLRETFEAIAAHLDGLPELGQTTKVMWVCTNYHGKSPPDLARPKIAVAARVRIDCTFPDDEKEMVGLYFTTSFGLTNRPAFDGLSEGWPAFEDWLLGETIAQYRLAAVDAAERGVTSLPAVVYFWAYGRPENLSRLSTASGLTDVQRLGSRPLETVFMEGDF